MSEIKYEITKHIGILSKSAKEWTKELNIISWNDREPKYDIREWSPEHEKMGKGITLSEEEMSELLYLFEQSKVINHENENFCLDKGTTIFLD